MSRPRRPWCRGDRDREIGLYLGHIDVAIANCVDNCAVTQARLYARVVWRPIFSGDLVISGIE
jgi:hypothetical protein